MGLPFDHESVAGAADRLLDPSVEGPFIVSTPNLNFARLAHYDLEFREALLDSDLLLVDGMPLVWSARLLGLPFRQRASGSTLLCYLFQKAKRGQLSTFFFGGREGAVEEAARWCSESTEVQVSGFLEPPVASVDELSSPRYLKQLEGLKTDLFLLCLPGQKGVKWIHRNSGSIDSRFFASFGTSLNFLTGRLARAPQWIQDLGFEWLFRLTREPRLMSRYLFDGLFFVYQSVVRTLPLALSMRAAGSARPPAISRGQEGYRLHGGFGDDADLSELRQALARVARTDGDIVLDLFQAKNLGCRLLGLLYLLRRHKRQQGFDLQLTGLSRSHRIRLWLAGVRELC